MLSSTTLFIVLMQSIFLSKEYFGLDCKILLTE